jgi:sterol 24-C-methyltransferase
LGNGLPDIIGTADCLEAMREAGFEVLHEHDSAELAKLEGSKLMDPWETPLMPSWNPLSQRFQFNAVGGPVTNVAIYLLELLRIAPAGTVQTQKVLQAGGFALRDAGREGIFTTMYLMVGRKPHAESQ